MWTMKDIAWLSGLLEGEGNFIYDGSPRIRVGMTDNDVIDKAAKMLNVYRVTVRDITKDQRMTKSLFTARCSGHIAAGWMMTIYSLMGQRRKAKIKEILLRWKKDMRYRKNNPTLLLGRKRCSNGTWFALTAGE